VKATSRKAVFVDTYFQEMLECDRIVLQEIGRLEEYGFSYQSREM